MIQTVDYETLRRLIVEPLDSSVSHRLRKMYEDAIKAVCSSRLKPRELVFRIEIVVARMPMSIELQRAATLAIALSAVETQRDRNLVAAEVERYYG